MMTANAKLRIICWWKLTREKTNFECTKLTLVITFRYKNNVCNEKLFACFSNITLQIRFNFFTLRLLFTRLGLLLLAIELKDDEKKECNIAINPGPNTIIQPQTQGFFIAQSADEVKRLCKHTYTRHIYKLISTSYV